MGRSAPFNATRYLSFAVSHTSATVAAQWVCGGNSGVFVECGGRDINILTDFSADDAALLLIDVLNKNGTSSERLKQ